MGNLILRNITKCYHKTEVLKRVDVDVANGEFVVIVGPSGCGKSTLLRIIAGLENQTSGEVIIGDKDVSLLAPAHRGIAMVFQSYALYPHLTVEGNMTLGLRQAREPAKIIADRVAEATRILELEPYLKRKPGQLSGGQRQRVAIGRAITRHPQVFLFDEPLSNLDAALRNQVRVEIADLHRRLGTTMIYVTHDQVEAMTLADRIVVMDAGIIQQIGTPSALYRQPANLFVAGFIGTPKINLLTGHMANARIDIDAIGVLSTKPAGKGPVTVGIRPADFIINADPRDDSAFSGKVIGTEYLGNVTYIRVLLGNGQTVVVEEKPDHLWQHDQPVYLGVNMANVHVFDGAGIRLDLNKTTVTD
ncbi:ABC transporter ATP-binding protein [Sodalis sp. dw_96]|uniref:ABC transporter ATP-binding protein n=1 Tax=Sodalis sp. dw_96 TaxID=2719794 RepID=UPI001BD275A4|nr:ABC transporter ATP-binding protein [Sodalis sp. dw_96]